MDGCIFCSIASGDLPARVVYEDGEVMAFDDISPQAPVHVLVIPRSHYQHLSDSVPADVLASVFAAVPLVAKAKGVEDSGYRVIVNSGRDANQTVPHLHVHVLAGQRMSHRMIRLPEE